MGSLHKREWKTWVCYSTLNRKDGLSHLLDAQPDNVKSLSLDDFKSKLRTILKTLCLYNVDEFFTIE